MVASAIEVYPRETNGLLIGRTTPRKIKRRVENMLTARIAYSFQTDERMPTSVSHGNISALNRLITTMDVLGKNIIGGYHSHPHPRDNIILTGSDIEFIEEEMKRLRDFERFKKMERWLEVVMSIRKREYMYPQRIGRTVVNEGKIHFKMKSDRYYGFDIKLCGYIVKIGNSKPTKERVELHTKL